MYSSQDKNIFSLPICRNALALQTAHENFLILCQIVLLPNINILISKQDTAN